MHCKSGTNDILWMVSGTATLLAFILGVLLFHAHTRQGAAAQLAARLQRLDRVDRMQAALASAVEAEKSAVLAVADADARQFAGQVCTATATIVHEREALQSLLDAAGTADEKEWLRQFSESLVEFQRIDKDLLALAVQNTNLKATSLVFGPATAALAEMDNALAQLPGEDAALRQQADAARIAAWRLLTLLPPHIAEESDAKMDAMEARMADEDRKVRHALETLAASRELAEHAELRAATAGYEKFCALKADILKLSRANTNVRSLAISLTEKRRITQACQAELTALHQAVEAEPVAGATGGSIRAR